MEKLILLAVVTAPIALFLQLFILWRLAYVEAKLRERDHEYVVIRIRMEPDKGFDQRLSLLTGEVASFDVADFDRVELVVL